jgi:hypothetical protein
MRAHTPFSVWSAEPYDGRTGQKTQRPTITSSAGSSVTIAMRPTAIPIARPGPMLAVEFISATTRQSMPTSTVAPLATIAGPRPVQRERHRLVPVLVAAQLLAVAGHQQQGVVGPSAEHQDREDALGLAVDGEDVVLREQVDHGLRRGQRDTRGDDGQQPQDRLR